MHYQIFSEYSNSIPANPHSIPEYPKSFCGFTQSILRYPQLIFGFTQSIRTFPQSIFGYAHSILVNPHSILEFPNSIPGFPKSIHVNAFLPILKGNKAHEYAHSLSKTQLSLFTEAERLPHSSTDTSSTVNRPLATHKGACNWLD